MFYGFNIFVETIAFIKYKIVVTVLMTCSFPGLFGQQNTSKIRSTTCDHVVDPQYKSPIVGVAISVSQQNPKWYFQINSFIKKKKCDFLRLKKREKRPTLKCEITY